MVQQNARITPSPDYSRQSVLDQFTPAQYIAAAVAPAPAIPRQLPDSSSLYTQQVDGFGREGNRPFGFMPTKGTSESAAGGDNVYNDGLAGEIVIDVMLPLSCISGVWDTDQLAPSFLMAGARLDMTISPLQQAFVIKTAAPFLPQLDVSGWQMTISNPKMVLETVTFTDAVLRSISMTSASSGLELPFVAMHYSQVPLASDSVSIQVNRGLSRANMVIVRAYPGASQTFDNTAAQLDSNRAYPIAPALADNAGGFQVKLGSEFMPNKPIDNFLQLYHATQNAFGNWKSDKRNTVTMNDFAGTGMFAGPSGLNLAAFPFGGTLGIYAMTLEKSSTLAQSGSPISASRDLNIVIGPMNSAKLRTPGATDLTVINDSIAGTKATSWNGLYLDVFVPYVCLCTVFLDSILVRS